MQFSLSQIEGTNTLRQRYFVKADNRTFCTISHWIGNCCGANSIENFSFYAGSSELFMAQFVAYLKTQPWNSKEIGQSWPMKHFFIYMPRRTAEAYPGIFNDPHMSLLTSFKNQAHGGALINNYLLDIS